MVPAAIGAIAAMLLTGCVNNETTPETDGSAAPEVAVDEAAAALLPENIKSAGVLTIGVDASYAPNEFEADDGSVTGWEVELGDAVAAKLGVKTDWKKLLFDAILPQVAGGTLDLGFSSFTDNAERQQQVDFVDYYEAGLQFAKSPDAEAIDPENLCGLSIAVQATTTSDQYLTDKSTECTNGGQSAIEIVKSDGQDEATSNVALGKVPYMLGDSPITQYAVAQSDGKIELAGDLFDSAPYGIVIAKDSALVPAIQAAVQSLIDDGTYTAILEKWGVEAGAVTSAEINLGS
ncbi:ABC transporter substrate-binding protein [Pseudoclavibacter chungangensis]|uniref:ABC transporter substrate-binding protein n=1 Tax=Pseudoclavibacter chungangensis TaxID=587635 RepID=A0A7J5BX31_9MICO|nr:ABC transporter substrate-binding protein [Pseudoclavibacter chungangensis]